MAALWVSCIVVGGGASASVLGLPSSSSSVATRASPVATFNGLRACPVLKQRAVIWRRPAAPRRLLTVTAAADEETLLTVQKLIAKQLAVDQSSVQPQSKFQEDLGADSLDTVEIIMAIEEEFKVSLEEGGAEKITTVQEAADLIYAVKNQSANA